MEAEMDTQETKHPGIFPLEIWELVLDQVDDTEDILHTFDAFPSLAPLSAGKQFSWIIGHVLLLLFPKLISFDDIKNCRLVSKRWMNAVGRCLERHPDRSPYKPVDTQDRTDKCSRFSVMTESHINYSNIPNVMTNFEQFYRSDSAEEILGFYKNRNPFPGRGVSIEANLSQPQISVKLNEVVPILKLLGHNIRYLSLKINFYNDLNGDLLIKDMVHPLFQCLYYMPNLKSLRLIEWGIHHNGIRKEASMKLSDLIAMARFPFRLESLHLSMDGLRFISSEKCMNKNLHNQFMSAFTNHDQLKRLAIHSRNWDKEFATFIPNLTELCVLSLDKNEMATILQDLQSSPLRKLEIRTSALSMEDILDVVQPHEIESLEVYGELQEYNGESVNTTPINSVVSSSNHRNMTIPAIRSLKVAVMPQHKLSFLSYLPSIEYLTLEIDREEWEEQQYWGWEQDQHETGTIASNICSSVQKIYGRQGSPDDFKFIWNTFPSLKLLTVIMYEVPRKMGRLSRFQYSRECQNEVFKS